MKEQRLHLVVSGRVVDIAVIERGGNGVPILFLHGFGGTKEDYADAARLPAFAGRRIIAFDFPGCGNSRLKSSHQLSVEFLVEVARAVLSHMGIAKFHLVGHSMGGLTALLLVREETARVVSFTNIEGNLAHEDCFLSSQAREYATADPSEFLRGLARRVTATDRAGFPVYGAGVEAKITPPASVALLDSIYRLTEAGGLLESFLALTCPRQFIYGEENSGLSYLETLAGGGVRTAMIRQSSHFPMYTNPVAMFETIASFVNSVEFNGS